MRTTFAHDFSQVIRSSSSAAMVMGRRLGHVRDALEIADLYEMARSRVPRMFFEYADSGSWTESTYRANAADFSQLKLRQRVAVDMSGRSLESTLVGQRVLGHFLEEAGFSLQCGRHLSDQVDDDG